MTTFNLVHTFYGVSWWWKPDVGVMSVKGVLLRIFVFIAILNSFPVFSSFAFSIVNMKRMAPMEIDIFQDIFWVFATTPALIARLQNLSSGHKWRNRCCCCFDGCLIYLYKIAICSLRPFNAKLNLTIFLTILILYFLLTCALLKHWRIITPRPADMGTYHIVADVATYIFGSCPIATSTTLRITKNIYEAFLPIPAAYYKFYGYLCYGTILPNCCGWASVLA